MTRTFTATRFSDEGESLLKLKRLSRQEVLDSVTLATGQHPSQVGMCVTGAWDPARKWDRVCLRLTEGSLLVEQVESR
jgi:hypothetical protein